MSKDSSLKIDTIITDFVLPSKASLIEELESCGDLELDAKIALVKKCFNLLNFAGGADLLKEIFPDMIKYFRNLDDAPAEIEFIDNLFKPASQELFQDFASNLTRLFNFARNKESKVKFIDNLLAKEASEACTNIVTKIISSYASTLHELLINKLLAPGNQELLENHLSQILAPSVFKNLGQIAKTTLLNNLREPEARELFLANAEKIIDCIEFIDEAYQADLLADLFLFQDTEEITVNEKRLVYQKDLLPKVINLLDKIKPEAQDTLMIALLLHPEKELLQDNLPKIIDSLPSLAPKAMIKLLDEVAKEALIECNSESELITAIFNNTEFLENLLIIKPDFLKPVQAVNIKFINQLDVLTLYQTGKLTNEQYIKYADSLGKDKILDPSLKLQALDKLDESTLPLVKKFLAKSVGSKAIADSDKFVKIVDGLNKIIQDDDTGLIESSIKASLLSGLVLLQPNQITCHKDEVSGYATDGGDVAVGSILRKPVKKIIGTIIHELTHKLMKFLFQNDADPYFTTNIAAKDLLTVISTELSQNEKAQKHVLFTDYTETDYHRELIAFFMGEKAGKLVAPEYMKDKYSITDSTEFAGWAKKHLAHVMKTFSELVDVIDSHIPTSYSEPTGLVLDYSGFDQEILGGTAEITVV